MLKDDSKNYQDLKPDIIIPFDFKKVDESPMAIIYVRPETNKIDYEAIIIRAISAYVEVVYMANLNGELLSKNATIAGHYASQIQFATNGKAEIANYPEMMTAFEKKFAVHFSDAEIIGAYEAIIEDKKDVSDGIDALFDIMVPEDQFLEFYGQTIKKIGRYYIVNYDIPAIMSKYDPQANIFVIAVRFKKKISFSELNYLIYNEFCKKTSIDLLDYAKRKNMQWDDQVRRTYHISKNHIQAMFDLTDFVYIDHLSTLCFYHTPLGRYLISQGILSGDKIESKLGQLKENPLVYLRQENQERKLINIIGEGRIKQENKYMEKSFDECRKLIKAVDW